MHYRRLAQRSEMKKIRQKGQRKETKPQWEKQTHRGNNETQSL